MGKIARKETDKVMTRLPKPSTPRPSLVDDDTLLSNQEDAILDTTELICGLMKERGISRSELAARMGTTKGNVTQILDGSRNMTIRTVSDVMTHLGDEFRASCKSREAAKTQRVAVFCASVDIRLQVQMPNVAMAVDSKTQQVKGSPFNEGSLDLFKLSWAAASHHQLAGA